jgi:hypothetical protein
MSLDSNWTGRDELGPEFTNTSTTRRQIQIQQAAIQFEKRRTTLLLLGASSVNSQESGEKQCGYPRLEEEEEERRYPLAPPATLKVSKDWTLRWRLQIVLANCLCAH